MKQDYFILTLAHSLHGKLRPVHVPHRALYGIAGTVFVAFLVIFGCVGSYARMASKVANYNSLQHEAQLMRERYENLQRKVQEKNEQLASLQLLADEVSTAYGVKKKLTGSPDLVGESALVPSMRDTLEEFNYLRSSNIVRRDSPAFPMSSANLMPAIWPVNGRLMGGYGQRSDPFSGEGAMHTGLDISAPIGTPVHATADGVVSLAARDGGYGRLVVVDHGNGYKTFYAHLSRMDVIEGQEIRRGDTLGAVGNTGRSTGPHLHYEVRLHSTPLNPYRFLQRPGLIQAAVTNGFPF